MQQPVIQQPITANPNVAPPVAQPPVAVVPAGYTGGPVRRAGSGRRGGNVERGTGHDGRGNTTGTRKQPGRSCKVHKNYRA